MKNITLKQHLTFALLTSLSLGLAPFGSPHILGKIKWLRGGAIGMKPIDWFDLFLHGAPWVYLILVVFLIGIKLVKR